MPDWSSRYRRIETRQPNSGPWEVWLSPTADDMAWDDFLRRTPYGQYQQSSLWAEYKAGEGWQHHRVLVRSANGIAGGFQILWKSKGPFKIGYVSKGPVAHPETPVLRAELTRLLLQSAGTLGLDALIIQPPDEVGGDVDASAEEQGFIRSNPLKVIEATYLVDVSEGMETVRRRMHAKTRQYVRKAREQGITVRAGTETDLPLFFRLMTATCQRQNTAPNPATLDSLRRLWLLFARSGSVEMAFAGRDGQFVAGRMNLIFGNRVTQWKKGWDGTHSEWHPNELLADHALEWAHGRGHRLCDFSAINRLTAESILAGRPTDPGIARSRDMFNLRLGGYPRLLPRAGIYLPNPILRWGYRQTYHRLERRRERQMLASCS